MNSSRSMGVSPMPGAVPQGAFARCARDVRTAILLAILMAGCASPQQLSRLSANFPATQPSDFYNQPAVAQASSSDFDALWAAAEQTARDFGFVLDRQDARTGLLTTLPLTSKQFFEIWRRDVPDLSDQADASLATYRRTLHFQFQRTSQGWTVTPYALIERLSWAETPISSTVYVQSAFGIRRGSGAIQSYGTHESDRGLRIPPRYWYATGRDETLEKQLADSVRARLK